MRSDEAAMVVTMICAMASGIALVAIVGGLRHARRKREWEHLERMKAIEAGYPPADARLSRSEGVWSASDAEGPGSAALARRCFETPIWVAFWGFLFGVPIANQSGPAGAFALAGAVGSIGVASVICGTVLAAKAAAGSGGRRDGLGRKPMVEDPDAFDVVGRRG